MCSDDVWTLLGRTSSNRTGRDCHAVVGKQDGRTRHDMERSHQP